jgi:hypothetical protein
MCEDVDLDSWDSVQGLVAGSFDTVMNLLGP